jgi:hypothetical protein
MSIGARCGSCNRELLLGQLLQSSDGFGVRFAGSRSRLPTPPSPPPWPLGSWPRRRPWSPRWPSLGRWPVTGCGLTGPLSSTQSPRACPRSRPSNPARPAGATPIGGPATLPPSPPNQLTSLNRHREPCGVPVLAEGVTLSEQLSPCLTGTRSSRPADRQAGAAQTRRPRLTGIRPSGDNVRAFGLGWRCRWITHHASESRLTAPGRRARTKSTLLTICGRV